jgi:F-type H+-transporting ATPase subunit b
MFITAAKAAETANNAAAAGVFPPFDTSHFVPQLIWLAITFGLLYWLMSKIALPRVQEIIETRRTRIENDLTAATEAQKTADHAAATYEKTLAEAKAKGQATAQGMRTQIAAESETRRKSLEDGLNAKISAAEAQIAQTKSQAMTNVASIAQEAASEIVQRLTGRTPDASAVSAAVASIKK